MPPVTCERQQRHEKAQLFGFELTARPNTDAFADNLAYGILESLPVANRARETEHSRVCVCVCARVYVCVCVCVCARARVCYSA